MSSTPRTCARSWDGQPCSCNSCSGNLTTLTGLHPNTSYIHQPPPSHTTPEQSPQDDANIGNSFFQQTIFRPQCGESIHGKSMDDAALSGVAGSAMPTTSLYPTYIEIDADDTPGTPDTVPSLRPPQAAPDMSYDALCRQRDVSYQPMDAESSRTPESRVPVVPPNSANDPQRNKVSTPMTGYNTTSTGARANEGSNGSNNIALQSSHGFGILAKRDAYAQCQRSNRETGQGVASHIHTQPDNISLLSGSSPPKRTESESLRW